MTESVSPCESAGGLDATTPVASVIVPTYNRLADLRCVLGALLEQIDDVAGRCEVVVVDDGSTDGTGDWLASNAAGLALTVARQENAGPARARNRGVAEAKGDIVLFLGDDTVPQPGWLREHLEAHRIAGSRTPVAVLGYTAFPASDAGPFLRWINEHGAQFGYALIDDPTDVPFNFFYTSNVSLSRLWFERLGGFREDFPAAAWEDIEFAYRAVAAGMSLRYIPRARTIHHHPIRVGSFCARQRKSGRSAAIFAGLHPELEAFLGLPRLDEAARRHPIRRALLRSLIAVGEWFPGTAGDRVYRRLLDDFYLEGLADGLGRSAASAEE